MTLKDMMRGNHECSVWHKARAQKMKFPLFYNPARTCCPTLRAPALAGGRNVGLQGVVGMVGASWGQGFKIAEVGTAVSGFRAGGLRQHSHSRRHSTPPPTPLPWGPEGTRGISCAFWEMPAKGWLISGRFLALTCTPSPQLWLWPST